MKIPLTEAAKKLNVHPIEVVVALAPLVSNFFEIYPDIDKGLVQTLGELLHQPRERQAEVPHKPEKLLQLSEIEKACLEKLARKKFWGHKAISEDVLRKNFPRGSVAPDKSIEKLIELDILVLHGKHKYSLNPQRKEIIDLITKRVL